MSSGLREPTMPGPDGPERPSQAGRPIKPRLDVAGDHGRGGEDEPGDVPDARDREAGQQHEEQQLVEGHGSKSCDAADDERPKSTQNGVATGTHGHDGCHSTEIERMRSLAGWLSDVADEVEADRIRKGGDEGQRERGGVDRGPSPALHRRPDQPGERGEDRDGKRAVQVGPGGDQDRKGRWQPPSAAAELEEQERRGKQRQRKRLRSRQDVGGQRRQDQQHRDGGCAWAGFDARS